jgi:hypothetical protein
MKYDKEHIKLFIDALSDAQGRVRACKIANINYQTFLDWMNDERKPEFSEAVKKAEFQGNDKLRDLSVRKIVEDKSWQSGAWWLERNFPKEFANKTGIDLTTKGDKLTGLSTLTTEELLKRASAMQIIQNESSDKPID